MMWRSCCRVSKRSVINTLDKLGNSLPCICKISVNGQIDFLFFQSSNKSFNIIVFMGLANTRHTDLYIMVTKHIANLDPNDESSDILFLEPILTQG